MSQGRVIGYVGMSGLATAPHLHYEFHIGGKVVNPVTVAMPRANPIDRKELAQFKSETAVYLAALDSDGTQRTAQAQTQKAIGGPATTAPTAAAITTAR